MNIITLHLSADTEQKLRHQARQSGQTLETYLERLAERAVASGTASQSGVPEEQTRYISNPMPTRAEFGRLIGDLAAGPRLPVLPSDFSRADIYDDHD